VGAARFTCELAPDSRARGSARTLRFIAFSARLRGGGGGGLLAKEKPPGVPGTVRAPQTAQRTEADVALRGRETAPPRRRCGTQRSACLRAGGHGVRHRTKIDFRGERDGASSRRGLGSRSALRDSRPEWQGESHMLAGCRTAQRGEEGEILLVVRQPYGALLQGQMLGSGRPLRARIETYREEKKGGRARVLTSSLISRGSTARAPSRESPRRGSTAKKGTRPCLTMRWGADGRREVGTLTGLKRRGTARPALTWKASPRGACLRSPPRLADPMGCSSWTAGHHPARGPGAHHRRCPCRRGLSRGCIVLFFKHHGTASSILARTPVAVRAASYVFSTSLRRSGCECCSPDVWWTGPMVRRPRRVLLLFQPRALPRCPSLIP